jgi:hypothetical protein
MAVLLLLRRLMRVNLKTITAMTDEPGDTVSPKRPDL